MNILIIEDEIQAAWDLKQTILKVRPQVHITAVLDSVSATQEWLESQPSPDLIFSDIQLGDGLIFDLFATIKLPCPVVFCTAFDEYLLRAFKTNGIDYLLKPIREEEVRQSLVKLEHLQQSLLRSFDDRLLRQAIAQVTLQGQYKTNFLVPYRDRMIPIATDGIMYFSITEKGGQLCTKEGKTYAHHFTLEHLSSVLDPLQFYRANRQYLLAYRAIREIEHYVDRKLMVHLHPPCTEKIIVSKAKASQFLSWMESR